MPTPQDPHSALPALQVGSPLNEAQFALIMVHGRGASAHDILSLADYLDWQGGALLAPQALGNVWYPQRFIAPEASNEPFLSSALASVGRAIGQAHAAGLPFARIALLGFSQGACLALEYAARNPQRYGAIIALSGALIERGDQPRTYTGSLDQTPIFLGCADVDAHIPKGRVERSAELLSALGAATDMRIYPGLGHTVNQDEIEAANRLIGALRPNS